MHCGTERKRKENQKKSQFILEFNEQAKEGNNRQKNSHIKFLNLRSKKGKTAELPFFIRLTRIFGVFRGKERQEEWGGLAGLEVLKAAGNKSNTCRNFILNIIK